MKKEVVVLDADTKQCKNLCALLTDREYMSTAMSSLTNMEQHLRESDCRAIILNLDNVSVTNKSLKGYDEMFNAIIMLVVAIAFSITMLGPWGFIKDAANVTETKQIISFLIYLAAIWGSALGVFPALFMLSAKGANRLAGNPVNNRAMTLRLAYILIPVGIFAWIAFSLPVVMVNYGYIISVFSDPLGLGWDLLGTANSHFRPFLPQWIPVIQGTVLLTGLYFVLSHTYTGLRDLLRGRKLQARAMMLPSLFALAVINIFLKLYMG